MNENNNTKDLIAVEEQKRMAAFAARDAELTAAIADAFCMGCRFGEARAEKKQEG